MTPAGPEQAAAAHAAGVRAGPRLGERLVALLCAVAAVLAGAASVTASQNGLAPASALVKMAVDEPLAELARESDPGFVFVNPQEHYDGVYYYAIARDPFLTGPEHERIDQSAYRYGHPMYGWLGGLLSLGRDRYVPEALLLLSFAGLGVGGYLVSRLSRAFGQSPWGGLLIATSPGLLYATTILTTETVAAALLAGTLLAWVRGRLAAFAVLVVLLCLTKEQYVVVPAGIGLYELVRAARLRRWPDRVRRRVLVLLLGPAALGSWLLYVVAQMGAYPGPDVPEDNFGPPGEGLLESFRIGRALSRGTFDQSQIGAVSAPILVAISVLVVLAVLSALRLRSPLDGVMLTMGAFSACLGWLTLVYPHEFVRNPSIVVLLAIAVLLARPGAAAPG